MEVYNSNSKKANRFKVRSEYIPKIQMIMSITKNLKRIQNPNIPIENCEVFMQKIGTDAPIHRNYKILSYFFSCYYFTIDINGSSSKITLPNGNVYWNDNAMTIRALEKAFELVKKQYDKHSNPKSDYDIARLNFLNS